MMEGWKQITIGDLGQVVTGNTPPKKDPANYGGEYPFIKPTDMNIDRRHVTEWEENYSEKAFKRYHRSYIPPKATGVVTIGTVGEKIFQADKWCFTNQSVNVVIPNEELYDPDFVYFLLKVNLPKVLNANPGTASGRHHVSKSNFCAIKILVPESKETQRKIASILSAYDDLIENNFKRIKLLEEKAQLTYEEWFVRMKFPGHETTPINQETGLPEGWEKKSFAEISSINPRTSIKKGTIAPYVSMGSISETSMIIDPIEERAVSGGTKFKNGDTLFARITPCLENGKTGFVQFLKDDTQIATGSTEFIVLRETDDCGRYFNYCTSREEKFRKLAIQSMVGSDGRQRVKTNCFDKYSLNQAPQKIRLLFENYASPLFKSVQNLLNQNLQLKEARDILLPRLMTGMIDLEQMNIETLQSTTA